MKELIIVSGLPRSGTSMMMQILEAAGVKVNTDGYRKADEFNPYGYYEMEKVKRLHKHHRWLLKLNGAVKVISHQLFYLPEGLRYKIIFMTRRLHDILDSQKRMRNNLQNDQLILMKYVQHLRLVFKWMYYQQNVRAMIFDYEIILNNPERELDRLAGFLGVKINGDIKNSIKK